MPKTMFQVSMKNTRLCLYILINDVWMDGEEVINKIKPMKTFFVRWFYAQLLDFVKILLKAIHEAWIINEWSLLLWAIYEVQHEEEN